MSKDCETVQRMTYTNFPIWCQLTTKTTWKCNADSFGPVRQLWCVTLKCMHESKAQRWVQCHKSLKVTQSATNGGERINKASKQSFANNFFVIYCKHNLLPTIFCNNVNKISCKYTQVLLSSWKFVSMFWIYKIMTNFCLIRAKSMKLSKELLILTCKYFPVLHF